ncbi:MAG TPA: dicarboxylate/amino acid:cation symporter [Thermoanaerobaculia bacterium]|nr:dicarboxylate/amino acid:cation symporter [Thermoanaerobaculia bacterium]
MLAGFIVGALGGLSVNLLLPHDARVAWLLDQVIEPVGEVFLRLVFMIIIPLIVSAFILGVTGLKTWDRVRSMGIRYVLFVLGMTVVLVGAAELTEAVVHPGRGITAEQRAELSARYGVEAAKDEIEAKEFPGLGKALVGLIPDNPIGHLSRALTVHDNGLGLPAVLIFSLFVAIAILMGPPAEMELLTRFFAGLFALSMNIVTIALKIAPFCIVFIAFGFTARLGLDLISSLSLYVATFFLAWLVAFGVVFPFVIWRFGGRSPLDFYRKIREPFWFAFVTSSSSATFPISLRTAKEQLGIPESKVRFVLTLGAVANQIGSSIFIAISMLFLADVFGVRISGVQELEIYALCVAFAFATPGVPGGNLPLLATLCLMFGIPAPAVALVVSVDRLMDMGVTTINVVGDLVLATVLAKADRGGADEVSPSNVTAPARASSS